MPFIHTYPCTNAQRAVVDRFDAGAHDIFSDLVWRSIEAMRSLVSLPHENEEGVKVQGGANKRVRNLAEYYFNASTSLVWAFPRQINIGDEYLPYMYLRGLIQGHSAPWIERLVERNGGEVPETWEYSDTRDPQEIK